MIIKDFLDKNLTPFDIVILYEHNNSEILKHITTLRLKDFLTPSQELNKENVSKIELLSKMIKHVKEISGKYWIKNFRFVFNELENETTLFIWY